MSDIYATPDANLDSGADSQKEYPGLRRLPYFLYSVGLNIAFSAIIATVAFVAESAVGMTNLVLIGPLIAVSVYLIVQRLRNLGASGWWAIGMFVPLLNIWVGIKTTAFPEGYDDHKTLDTAAKVIIGLLVGAMVLGIGAAIMLGSQA